MNVLVRFGFQPDRVLDSVADVDPLALVEEFFEGEVLPLASISS